jgi:hypothetical protein
MRRLTSMFVLLGAGALLASGCADNDSGLFVRAVLVRESPECLANPDPSAAFWAIGTYDVSFGDLGYIAPLLVGNQLVPRGSPNQIRTETSRIVVRGAEVSVVNGSSTVAEFTQTATGFVDPGSGTDPGYGVAYATLVPPGLASAGQRLTVDVRVFGETLGGDEITSESLTFPIVVCDGCLVSFPPGSVDPNTGLCVGSTGNESDELPCSPGQDEYVPCTTCGGLSDRCLNP